MTENCPSCEEGECEVRRVPIEDGIERKPIEKLMACDKSLVKQCTFTSNCLKCPELLHVKIFDLEQLRQDIIMKRHQGYLNE